MIVMVTGGRNFGRPHPQAGISPVEWALRKKQAKYQVDYLRGVLSRLHVAEPIEELIHGNAPGGDLWSAHWAVSFGVKLTKYQAEWDRHGKQAGVIRNRVMFDRCADRMDLLVAFPGGSGTNHMVSVAEEGQRLGIWDGFIHDLRTDFRAIGPLT